MSGAAVGLLVAIGVAALLSLMMWAFWKMPRRSRTFTEHLDALVARRGPPVGPSSGISRRKPLQQTKRTPRDH